jgi:WD40 repeat protein
MRFVRFTPDGKRLLHAGFDRIVALDTSTWRPAGPELVEKGLAFAALELSPDGKALAVGPSFLAPGGPALHDLEKGIVLGSFQRAAPDLIQNGPLTLSADGKWLVSAAYPIRYGPPKAPGAARGEQVRTPARIQLWDTASRKLLRDWDTDELDLVKMELSADGTALVGSFQNGKVCVWATATGKERLRFRHKGHLPFNFWSSLSPDGKVLATADSCDTLVRFWDLGRGKQVGEFRGQLGIVQGVAFSPDGSRLAVWSDDTTTLLVDVRRVVGKR